MSKSTKYTAMLFVASVIMLHCSSIRGQSCSYFPADLRVAASLDSQLQANYMMGKVVCGLGDVDGGGKDDFAIASPDKGGRVAVYLGENASNPQSPLLPYYILKGSCNTFGCSSLGFSVASLNGDVDGDNRPDFIVGDPSYLNSPCQPGTTCRIGRALIISGATGSVIRTHLGAAGDPPKRMGVAVAGIGDVNDDGIPDYAIGSPGYSQEIGLPPLKVNMGQVSVYSGANGAGLYSISGGEDYDSLGYTIVPLTTPTGKRFAVGAPGPNGGFDYARIYSGQSGAFQWQFTTVTIPPLDLAIGKSLGRLGDINGDGYDELLIGFTVANSTCSSPFSVEDALSGNPKCAGYPYLEEGKVRIQSGHDFQTLGEIESASPWWWSNASFGFSVTGIGDQNDDGIPDIVVGEPGYCMSLVYLYSGSDLSLLCDIPSPKLGSSTEFFNFGISVANGGDINGDGRDDILIGAPGVWSGCAGMRDLPQAAANVTDLEDSTGGVFIFFGNCCRKSTGNVDNDANDAVDVGDLTALIDNLFISFTPLACEAGANCDGQGGIDVSDLTALIDFLFISFQPLAPCQ